jgi:DNA replication protein DnaC
VRFYSTVELVNTLEQEKASGRAGRLAHQLMHLDLVILDELGCAPRGADSPRGLRSPPATVAAVARS